MLDMTVRSLACNDGMYCMVYSIISGDLYNTRKELLLNALCKKLKALNSGNYDIKPEMNLFIVKCRSKCNTFMKNVAFTSAQRQRLGIQSVAIKTAQDVK
ncbi:MAG: hypothetical protein NC299_04775 [Lachnospiraceae bacterium]|nr:hypothetical protein [Ruminococcus sp.]MCM1274663.1 hypothetical protein [Lachnospiraceae bacterium]